jgi:hypothetical protein
MHRYSGKTWSNDDIERIRELIEGASSANRAQLSRQICEAFDWRMPDGRLKEMRCRVVMLKMDRDGLIKLPAPRQAYRRMSAVLESEASEAQPTFEVKLGELTDLSVELVATGAPSRLWNEFIARYHYLGYKPLTGAQLRYFVKAQDRVLGAFGFCGAAWKVASRDLYIGWGVAARERRLHLVVNQSRFLILPWVRCQNLATKALSLVNKRLAGDWQARYGYRPVLIETFTDTTRYPGTCYKAGNWLPVGLTKGRSKYDRFHKNATPVKCVWLMPLSPRWRDLLQGPAAVEPRSR